MSGTDLGIVVCGGGIIGCSIAYHLAKKGVKCTVIERNGIASAASGKAGGFLARNWCDNNAVGDLARLSFDMHAELAKKLPNCDYRRMDTLSALIKEGAHHKANDAGSWLDGPLTKKHSIGTQQDTAQVHPYKLTHAMINEAKQRVGTTVLQGTVKGVQVDNGTVTAVDVDGNMLTAKVVIISLGPWSGLAVGWLKSPSVIGLRAHSIVLRPVEGTVPAESVFLDHISKAGKHTDPEVYPRPDGTVYLCGANDEEPLPPNPADVVTTPEAQEYLQNIASSISTVLHNAAVEHNQACYLPLSDDGLPIIGPIPGVEGAFMATGHYCWGILNAPVTGHIIADIVTSGHCDLVDITPFLPGRFKTSK